MIDKTYQPYQLVRKQRLSDKVQCLKREEKIRL